MSDFFFSSSSYPTSATINMDTLHKQSFAVTELATRSVTLFPTKAQIIRDIKDISLKPGLNEITVVGITPTADEHSIKVEGSGSAIITDIVVELLPNRDIFQEVYPESDSDHDSSSESEEEDEEKVNEELENVRSQIVNLNDELARAKEITTSAERRLAIIDNYGDSLALKKEEVNIGSGVETYRTEREKIFRDHMEAHLRERDLVKQMTKIKIEERRLQRLEDKEQAKIEKQKAKAERAKAKIREKERRRKAEREKEKARIKKERENFWPRRCYTVRITLDAASFTPSSSRRSSIASIADVKLHSDKEESPVDGYTCDLSLSYVTSSAFWNPTYDLALNTQTNTAILCFDAQLTNMTSETWTNSRVVLSTSEASFSGLQDDAPTLVPWLVKLGGRGHGSDIDGAIRSREERAQKETWVTTQNAMNQQKPRANLFGLSESSADFVKPALAGGLKRYASRKFKIPNPDLEHSLYQGLHQVGQVRNHTMQQIQPTSIDQGQMMQLRQLQIAQQIRAQQAQQAQQAQGIQVYSQAQAQTQAQREMAEVCQESYSPGSRELRASVVPLASVSMAHRKAPQDEDEGASSDSDDGAPTVLEANPELSFQESCVGEEGLTTNYELPNLKTLKPSSTASKQRVARISFSNVLFSRTAVPKYKPAVYLKARIRNTSKLTLLKGSTGLTLDGTFLGRSTLPRCSAGDAFKISLGIDPGIKVIYPKPDVRRSTTGVFTKGENSVYTRYITLANTRAAAGKAVDITVLDQIPVSEDEKLRVDVGYPRGLLTGSAVPTGMPGKDGVDNKDWGRAVAQLKKGGEVSFEVSLNAGRSVKLVLEYELVSPNGEKVVEC
ncbi:hypothetical protein QBC38DRAFT_490998 [Podospora fimiseda]|uniref:Mucoidy inhibitor-like protein n=1 Tax=Podospora fimiseda TaxID=252190 RepID=A0AAN7BFT6_9PEZI|nr:hypothetical protein QBC38DRAFT_490998 [Podospora fimiseda]